MALFPMAVITLFWKDQIGLSLADILLLQAIFSVATVVMEYPSGYLSDRLGYRFSLLLASLLGVTGWATYTVAGNFATVLLAEIQLGISYAFISGADSALLFETLRSQGREEEYLHHDGRMTAWAQAGEAAGAVGAGVLYAWLPLLPFILQVAVWLVAWQVCRQLRDPGVHRPEAIASHWREARDIARRALCDSPPLRWALLFGALLGLASFFPVWLIQPYMQQQGVPLAWFGPIWAVANLTVSLGSILSARAQFQLGTRGVVWLCLALTAAGYLGLAATGAVWGFAWYFLLTLMRGLQGPLLRLHIQQCSRRSERASTLSLKSLLFRIGFVAAAPLVGGMADRAGLPATFLAVLTGLAVLLVPLAICFLSAATAGKSPVAEETNRV
ncbi:MAG: MFS transporter [Deltaproteobacteria bacterium]|nr:MAG: MFS transporter [Deltaproteobacteria bacterium]